MQGLTAHFHPLTFAAGLLSVCLAWALPCIGQPDSGSKYYKAVAQPFSRYYAALSGKRRDSMNDFVE